jgi:Transposase DDE domain/Domain of unknown function (DUF4372)
MAKRTGGQFSVLRQICEIIPPHLVPRLARAHGVDVQARDISPWSHVVVLLLAQFTHAIGLNDACDSARYHAGKLRCIRGATPPSRNGFSNANRKRDAAMARDLFFKMLDHLMQVAPGFGGRTYKGMPRRFKRTIHVLDSSTIQLVANCMDWAKHRQRKAAAKLHLSLNLQNFLPAFALVSPANEHDSQYAARLCAPLQSGEIALFDKAYIAFDFLWELTGRGVFFVTRSKENLKFRVVKRRLKKPCGNILCDDEVLLSLPGSRNAYPQRLRRVTAMVELEGRGLVEMTFLTNNFEWAPGSVAELYRCRWAIEAFFKQIKQTLKLGGFLGQNQNAIEWQIWTALLVYLLLRFMAWRSQWPHSFTRIFTVVRALLWDEMDIDLTLRSCGTAGGHFKLLRAPAQAYLPGFG